MKYELICMHGIQIKFDLSRIWLISLSDDLYPFAEI